MNKNQIIKETLKKTFWECTNYKPLLLPAQYKEFTKQLTKSLRYALNRLEKEIKERGKG